MYLYNRVKRVIIVILPWSGIHNLLYEMTNLLRRLRVLHNTWSDVAVVWSRANSELDHSLSDMSWMTLPLQTNHSNLQILEPELISFWGLNGPEIHNLQLLASNLEQEYMADWIHKPTQVLSELQLAQLPIVLHLFSQLKVISLGFQSVLGLLDRAVIFRFDSISQGLLGQLLRLILHSLLLVPCSQVI